MTNIKKIKEETKLSIQMLVRINKKLENLIDTAFSMHLKTTGEYISRSEFVRQMITAQCEAKISAK